MLQSACAGSCIHDYIVPKIRGGVLIPFCALFWSTDKKKSGLLCKSSSFSGWEIQKQCSFVIHKHIYGIFDKLLDHISHNLITSLKLMWSLDVLHNNLGGIYFLHLGGGNDDMFSMWKFSKLTEFHSHQSSHTAQQMIQSLQRDFICADSNPLT